jgi:hypothetical protein
LPKPKKLYISDFGAWKLKIDNFLRCKRQNPVRYENFIQFVRQNCDENARSAGKRGAQCAHVTQSGEEAIIIIIIIIIAQIGLETSQKI